MITKIGSYTIIHTIILGDNAQIDFNNHTIKIDRRLRNPHKIRLTLMHECYHIAENDANRKRLRGGDRHEYMADRIAYLIDGYIV